jgi:hypothetical protein
MNGGVDTDLEGGGQDLWNLQYTLVRVASNQYKIG